MSNEEESKDDSPALRELKEFVERYTTSDLNSPADPDVEAKYAELLSALTDEELDEFVEWQQKRP